jgi:hypothetical protein
LTPAPVNSPDLNGNLIGGRSSSDRISPFLGPLADHGGPTMTHALLGFSPAVDAGDSTAMAGANGVPLHDQRGAPFARVHGERIDMGAFEAVVPVLLGDYNQDGKVGAADFAVWRDSRGRSGLTPYSGADGSGNGTVDNVDRAVWAAHFGRTLPPLGAASGASSADTPANFAGTGEALGQIASAVNPAALTLRASRISAHRPALQASLRADQSFAGNRRDDALLAWLASRPVEKRQWQELDVANAREDAGARSRVDEVCTGTIDQVFALLTSV